FHVQSVFCASGIRHSRFSRDGRSDVCSSDQDGAQRARLRLPPEYGVAHRARHILVATGGEPFVPHLPGAEWIKNSDDFFYLDQLDRKSVVGKECGSWIAR